MEGRKISRKTIYYIDEGFKDMSSIKVSLFTKKEIPTFRERNKINNQLVRYATEKIKNLFII